jgi:hypothetical protein
MGRSLRWPTKDPGSTRTYALDVSDDIVNTIIQSVSASVMPSGVEEMAVNAMSVSGDTIELSLTGGVAGRSYLVKIDVTPFGTFPVEYICWIYIDRTLAAWPVGNPDLLDFGAPATWAYAPSMDFSKKQNTWMISVV